MLEPRGGLHARTPAARRHLRPGLSLDELFTELGRRGVRYAVLRWFETLPHVEAGEDVDLLVADEHLHLLDGLLDTYAVPPRTQKFDVYSVEGAGGADFRGVPYFPAALATGLLDRAVLLRGRYRVPGTADHFDSLAYHAVYHKGTASGLPEDRDVDPATAPPGEHDYAAVLARLAGELGRPVPRTLEDLDEHLVRSGLRPPLDTLDKLAAANEWLRRRIDKEFGPRDAGIPGLGVFVLRERALGQLERLQRELGRAGWQPLETVLLSGDAADRVRAGVRGGNWGRGPWPVSGGGPAAYVVACDLSASSGRGPDAESAARVADVKLALRRRLQAGDPGGPAYNPVHSSDDPRQALDYLQLLEDPALVPRLQRGIDRLRAAMEFPHPVVEVLPSQQRRAVTAVVAHPEFGHCVCKLFFPGAERFLARELRARTEFAALPEVPRLLEAGERYLLTPLYGDDRSHVRRVLAGSGEAQLTPQASAALARLARDLHEAGVYLLDLGAQNLVTDPVAGLTVLDWEFLQDTVGPRPPLRSSPTVLGRVDDPAADIPLGVSTGDGAATVYRSMVTGVPAALLFSVSPAVLAVLAGPGQLAWALVRVLRTATRRVLLGSRRTVRSRGGRVLRAAASRAAG